MNIIVEFVKFMSDNIPIDVFHQFGLLQIAFDEQLNDTAMAAHIDLIRMPINAVQMYQTHHTLTVAVADNIPEMARIIPQKRRGYILAIFELTPRANEVQRSYAVQPLRDVLRRGTFEVPRTELVTRLFFYCNH